jgi:hypothetical protein
MSFDFKKVLSKESNVGAQDRNIRFGAGSALLVGSLFILHIPLLVLGGVLVATGFTRTCPVYSGLGKSTIDPNEPPAAPSCCGGHDHSHGQDHGGDEGQSH